ncbi:MAG: methanogenesis marker 17 protein [Methanoregulaceae archaeon]
MDAVEYFEVECPEALGGENYKRIMNVVLLDHNLIRVIRKIDVFINPEIPLYVAVGVTGKIPSLVRVRDFANVNVQENKVTLAIADETYLAPLLKILWEKYGGDKVEQPDRFTVIIHISNADMKEIEETPVKDPSESIYKDLIYALRCIAPEGFRVRREVYKDGKFYFVASEDTLPENIAQLIADRFAKIGEVMP